MNINPSIIKRNKSEYYKKYKLFLLNEFINKNKNLAPQGSEEWHKTRKYSIGGSEMAIITGENPYQKLDSLVAGKIGFTKFNGNLATRWGNLFEYITNRLTEIIFNADITETGSLEGSVKNQRYSPDGLGVVKTVCYSFEKQKETIEHCIVLFEYKSPFISIPNGVIPKHYMPQVKTGLCSIPITDFAIFISNMYRKCPLEDLKNNISYDTKFHNKDSAKKINIELPLAYGIIVIYQTDFQKEQFKKKYFSHKEFVISYESEDSDDLEYLKVGEDVEMDIDEDQYNSDIELYKYFNKYNNNTYILKDFGKSGYYEFDNLMTLIDENLVSVEYLEPSIINKELWEKNDLLKYQNLDITNPENKPIDILKYQKNNFLGFIPWKLFKSDIIHQSKEENYVKNYQSTIDNTVNILHKINNTNEFDEKIEIFKKEFPKSKILKNNGYDNSDYMDFLIK